MTVEKNIKRIRSNLLSFMTRVTSNKQMVAMGKEAIRLIVKRSRLGFGVENDGDNRFRFPGFSRVYLIIRKQHRLDPTTRPSKSNITFSGQLLRSVKVITARKGTIKIGPRGTRRPTAVSKIRSNKKLAEILANRLSRPFMSLSKAEQSQLRRFYRKNFDDLVKKDL